MRECFSNCVQLFSGRESEHTHQIMLDVHRTFPTHELFAEVERGETELGEGAEHGRGCVHASHVLIWTVVLITLCRRRIYLRDVLTAFAEYNPNIVRASASGQSNVNQ